MDAYVVSLEGRDSALGPLCPAHQTISLLKVQSVPGDFRTLTLTLKTKTNLDFSWGGYSLHCYYSVSLYLMLIDR